MQATPTFQAQAVAQAFAAFPDTVRDQLLTLRALIFETAAGTPGVGPLQETLKWGQPAYLTAQTKSGTTIRLATPKAGGFGLYVHCQTTLIGDFQGLFPQDFSFDGNRGVVFAEGAKLPEAALTQLIHAALTYHLK